MYPKLRSPLSFVLLALVASVAMAQDERPAASPDIDGLIRELDSDDFETREDATEKLIELGAAVRPKLEQLAKNPPSAEVKVRLQKIFRGIELAEIRANAIHLEDIFELVRRANDDDLDKELLQQTLEQLHAVLGEAVGKEEFRVPASFEELTPQEPDTFIRNGLVVASKGRISSLRDSIVLANVAINVSSAQNSIIIARAGVDISSPRNCLIIAGYDVRVSSATDCVILSGQTLDASISRDCVLAATQPLRLSIAKGGTVVNSQLAREPSRDPPAMVKTEGLVLRDEAPENPLADKIQVTYASGDVVLFKRANGGGEIVARMDKPVEHPDGGLIEELEGWQACHVSRSRQAIFTDGKRFAAMPVGAP